MNRDMFGQPGPWGGLPVGQAPWAGSEMWQAAQQAPWRLSPWQTQGMPQGAPPPAPPPAAPAPNPYLSQGTSMGLPSYNPTVPGGGFYKDAPLGGLLDAAPAAPAAAPLLFQSNGQVMDSYAAARKHNTALGNDLAASGEFDQKSGYGPVGGWTPARMAQHQAQQRSPSYQTTGSILEGLTGEQVFAQMYGV